MFISNISKISHKLYKCNKTLGEKIVKLGVPLLGRFGEDMFFANTDILKEALKKIQEAKKNE